MTDSVVTFWAYDLAILVTILAVSVLSAMKPEGNEVVFIKDPLDASAHFPIL
jgi:hypothetical protein